MGVGVLRWMMLAVLSLALPAAAKGGPGQSGDLAPEDQKAIHDYKLTNSTIDKLLAAGAKLRALAEKDPAMAKFRPMDAKNIDESVKRMAEYPQGVAALKSAGLSPREFMVGTYALMTAAMWITMKKSYPQAQAPEYVNPGNMKFVDDHPEVLKKFQDAWGTKGNAQ